jgi:hypothetical protein
VAVGPGLACPAFIEGLEGAREEKDGRRGERGVPFDRQAHLVPTSLGHGHICEDQIRAKVVTASDGVVPVVDARERNVFMRERDRDHLLDGHAVICKQNFFRHEDSILRAGWRSQTSNMLK